MTKCSALQGLSIDVHLKSTDAIANELWIFLSCDRGQLYRELRRWRSRGCRIKVGFVFQVMNNGVALQSVSCDGLVVFQRFHIWQQRQQLRMAAKGGALLPHAFCLNYFVFFGFRLLHPESFMCFSPKPPAKQQQQESNVKKSIFLKKTARNFTNFKFGAKKFSIFKFNQIWAIFWRNSKNDGRVAVQKIECFASSFNWFPTRALFRLIICIRNDAKDRTTRPLRNGFFFSTNENENCHVLLVRKSTDKKWQGHKVSFMLPWRRWNDRFMTSFE